ncbi:hypothetical protein DFJ77DRAFT_448440 [Powellomyces hirtus]|nr:hypothetical protein DFJ77DRAFT_448440 [Powellomyces hirtus]
MQEAIAEADAEQPSEHTANESKDSDEDEWEEETRYIVLDLGTEVTSETVQAAAASHEGVSIVGLDSSAPHLRVGNLVFRGTLDRTLGTDLIFATSKHDDARPQRNVTWKSGRGSMGVLTCSLLKAHHEDRYLFLQISTAQGSI